MSGETPPHEPPRVPRWHVFNLTLWGIPELRLFPTRHARQQALQQISDGTSDVKSWSFWSGVLLSAAMIVLVGAAVRWGLDRVTWPRIAEVPLYYGSLALAVYATLSLLHRRGAAEELRNKLLACGVPICRGCGYLLKALPLDPGRCPECGRSFDEEVRAILTRQAGPN